MDFIMQSTLHVAIIMDGNGRWAQARGWPRVAGHRAGADAIRRVVEAAPGLGVRMLTLYAFSSDNWQRPPAEVATLMRLFREYLASETAKCVESGVRIRVIGRRDRLHPELQRAIRAAEAATEGCDVLDVRIAVDYSSRDAILAAAQAGAESRPAFCRTLGVPGRRPSRPHRRRAASQRLPAVGVRLRGALLHGPHVARFRQGRPGRRDLSSIPATAASDGSSGSRRPFAWGSGPVTR